MVNVLDFFSLESANVTLLFERLMREPSFSNSLPQLRVTGPCSRSSSLSSKVAEVGPDMDIVSIRYGSKINFCVAVRRSLRCKLQRKIDFGTISM